MKPLPRENTIWEFLRAQIFMILGTCFTVSSRIYILSIFYRILSVLGPHFETLGPTFWKHIFRSQKLPEIFLVSAPGATPSSTPPGEGGNHRRFSPLTLPTSKKGSCNIWPSVDPRKTQLVHDIWSPFWHLFLVDLTLGGAWETPLGPPWDHL